MRGLQYLVHPDEQKCRVAHLGVVCRRQPGPGFDRETGRRQSEWERSERETIILEHASTSIMLQHCQLQSFASNMHTASWLVPLYRKTPNCVIRSCLLKSKSWRRVKSHQNQLVMSCSGKRTKKCVTFARLIGGKTSTGSRNVAAFPFRSNHYVVMFDEAPDQTST